MRRRSGEDDNVWVRCADALERGVVERQDEVEQAGESLLGVSIVHAVHPL